ncbi:MAG: methylated-DNA--[protein]-cysteine S-methyltransferase [Bacteroidales bacterium]|nr:methylated-DNA--[protein]-cysteine S-methyltransferase [Bacteroidales bacterium]
MNKAKELGITACNEGQLNYKVVESVMGNLTVVASSVGIVAILFGENDLSILASKMRLVPVGTSTPLLENAITQLKEYFARERHEFSLPLHIVGTEFQKSVWEAIRTVTYSKTVSYKQIALMIGKEKSVRAVAQACGANRLPIIIPCHRIIASNGALGGYSAGVDKKEFLLKLEGTLK